DHQARPRFIALPSRPPPRGRRPAIANLSRDWRAGECPPSAFVRGLEGAVAGARLVDPPGEPRRNNGDDDRHEVDAALVPDDVGVVAVVDEARSSWNDVWRAGGIVAFVKRRRTGLDDHQAGAGVAVPAEGPARCDRVLTDV